MIKAPARALLSAVCAAAALFSAASADAPITKIGFLDTRAFADSTVGVKQFLAKIQALNTEFKPREEELAALRTKLQTLVKELEALRAKPGNEKAIADKQLEGERLQKELKRKQEDGQAEYERRQKEVLQPVTIEIGAALREWTKANGYTAIVDIAKSGELLLALDPAADVTLAFINDYNEKHK